MPEYSLGAVVRAAAEKHREIEPSLIAEHVMRDMNPADYELALSQAILPFVRQIMSQGRPRAGFTSRLGSPGSANSANSARRDRIRDAYLESAYSVNGVRKRLGDCTPRDLMVIATALQAQSDRLALKAQDMRNLADEVIRCKVATVSALPPATLAAIFS